MQKAVNYALKGHLLQAKRWHIAKPLTVRQLQDCGSSSFRRSSVAAVTACSKVFFVRMRLVLCMPVGIVKINICYAAMPRY